MKVRPSLGGGSAPKSAIHLFCSAVASSAEMCATFCAMSAEPSLRFRALLLRITESVSGTGFFRPGLGLQLCGPLLDKPSELLVPAREVVLRVRQFS